MREHLRTLFGRQAGQGAGRRGAGRPGGPPERPAPPAILEARGNIAAMRGTDERVLLSILINHNELVHGVAEEIADISLTNRELDRILREILNVAVDQPDLDSKALQRHLIECGFRQPLAAVLNAKTYRQAPVAAPEAKAEDAARLLGGIIASYRRQRLAVDRAAATQELADEMTSENKERHLEIVREQTGTGGL